MDQPKTTQPLAALLAPHLPSGLPLTDCAASPRAWTYEISDRDGEIYLNHPSGDESYDYVATLAANGFIFLWLADGDCTEATICETAEAAAELLLSEI